MLSPTEITYNEFVVSYNFFNDRLFATTLPACLITLQRKARTRGYYSNKRFTTRDERDITDEIALNPACFRDRTDEEILSTLVHEMVHLWQYHFGTPSRGGYHNRECGDMMQSLGLMPSHNGELGGRRTGQRITHYIIMLHITSYPMIDLP